MIGKIMYVILSTYFRSVTSSLARFQQTFNYDRFFEPLFFYGPRADLIGRYIYIEPAGAISVISSAYVRN